MANGLLIAQAEESGYELLISPDQGIQHQQNLANRQIALLVLMKNDWGLIRPLVGDIITTVNRIQPGEYAEIDFPMPPLEPYTSGGGSR